MNKHISVIGLAVRNMLPRLLCLIVVMGAVEGAAFGAATHFFTLGFPGALSEVFTRSGIAWIYAVAMLGVCALLSATGCSYGGTRVELLIGRLRMSERAITVEWAACSIACLLVFWAVQLGIVLSLCCWYMQAAEDGIANQQTILTAFYYNDFLHSLLPLREVSRWVRNGVLALCLGMTTASLGCVQRRGGKNFFCGGLLFGMAAATFSRPALGSGTMDLIVMIAAVMLALPYFYRLWRGYDDEAEN